MNNITLTPWFISGFTDAEGCFSIIINRNKERRLGWAVQLEFKIELHVQDILLLYKIQDYFGVGSVTQYGKVARYYTSSIKDLINVIIPHFTKYPLHTQKGADFILFKLAALLIEKGEHLTRCGLQQIVNFKASINWGLSDVLKQAFPNTIPYPRTMTGVSGIPLDWLAGFISGDGNFSITLGRVNLLGIRTTRLFFSITQHIKDLPLMKSLVEVLGCGFVIIYENKVIFRAGYLMVTR